MFSVVLGHVALPKETISLIYSFHMPLFFIISGMTLNDSKILQTPLKDTIIDKAKKLIIPYLWMSFIMFPMWFVTFKLIGSTKTTLFQAFKGIFYGNNTSYYSGTSNALWFLLTLFFANILYSILVKLSKNNETGLASLIVLCGIIGFLDKGVAQIWHLNVTFTAVVFMYIGRCFMKLYKENSEWFESRKEKGKYLLILLLCIIGLFSHHQNGRISMTANKFGNSLLLYYITAVAFSFAIIIMVILLPKIKLFEFVGKNTLLYVGLHIPIIRLFENAFPIFKSELVMSVLLAIGVYLVMIIICMIFNKVFPYVCAKPSLKGDKIIDIGKYFISFVCIIIPVYAVFEKLCPALSMKATILAVLGVTLAASICITLIAERLCPVIYSQKTKE